MGYIEQTDIGNVYFTDINDWLATLSNLNRECKTYTDSEIRYKEIIAEHDEQIRATERKNILDVMYKLVNSDYNSKECKLFISDVLEMLGE